VRVLVIGDMEGVSGICRWEQVTAGEAAYEECRLLYTEEMNAAARRVRDRGRAVRPTTRTPTAARRA
jgi:D-amino peptidase